MKPWMKVFLVVLLIVVVGYIAGVIIGADQQMDVEEKAWRDAFENIVRSALKAAELEVARNEGTDYSGENDVAELDISGEDLTGIWYVLDEKIILKNVSNGKYCIKEMTEENMSDVEVLEGAC